MKMETKETKLRLKEKMPRKFAHEMIMLFVRHGNHYHDLPANSDAYIKKFFEHNNIPFTSLVENCRCPHVSVPFFENKIGSMITLQGNSEAKLSQIDMMTGEEKVVIQGPGVLSQASYWSLAEVVISSRDLSIEKSSFHEFLNAISNGVASIEAYVNKKVIDWNDRNPANLLVDNKVNKVSFETKLTEWVPIMTNGKCLNKGEKNWSDLKKIISMRDNLAIHPKYDGYGMTFTALAENLNLLRTGIAGILIDLHLLFNDRLPRVIIRMRYSPDVETFSC